MKKYLLMLVAAAGSLAMNAQQNPIETYFSDFLSNEEFTQITFSGKMFEMANHIEATNEEEEELLEAFRMIKGVAVVASEDKGSSRANYTQARKRPGTEFESLVTINDKDGNAEVLIKEQNGVVTEVLVIAGGEEGFAVVGIWGEIDLNTLAELTREFQLSMMENYDAEAATAGRDVSMFPNPAPGGQVSVDLPQDLEGAMVRIHNMNGTLITERSVTSTRVQFDTANLSNGTYIVSVTKGNNTVFTEQLIISK
ncbi:MAG: DUF4252 domain-containing protein [Flavobacteriales bacterium]|nr:DUF4252 domain-containing protein [Flavobacteriales bacterium]